MMYSAKLSPQTIDPRGVHMYPIVRALGNLLLCMATLDKILLQNEVQGSRVLRKPELMTYSLIDLSSPQRPLQDDA